MCSRAVYVTNIDKKVSQTKVKLYFESFCGEVYRLRLLGDNHHCFPNRICGFVAEVALEEYFKLIDKEAEIIMQTQLGGEEKSMREMVMTMQRQALLEQAEAERNANSLSILFKRIIISKTR